MPVRRSHNHVGLKSASAEKSGGLIAAKSGERAAPVTLTAGQAHITAAEEVRRAYNANKTAQAAALAVSLVPDGPEASLPTRQRLQRLAVLGLVPPKGGGSVTAAFSNFGFLEIEAEIDD